MNTGQHPEALYENVFMTQPNLKDTGLLDAVGCCWGTLVHQLDRVPYEGPGTTNSLLLEDPTSAISCEPNDNKRWRELKAAPHSGTWDDLGRKWEKECCGLALLGIFKLQTSVISVEAWHPSEFPWKIGKEMILHYGDWENFCFSTMLETNDEIKLAKEASR